MLFLEFFKYYHTYQGFWKNAEPTFQRISILQSWGQGPEKMENYGQICSLLLTRIGTLSTDWRTTQHLFVGWAFFFIDLDIHGYFEKLPKYDLF